MNAGIKTNITLVCILALCACSRETVPSSEFVSYISAYTGGLIYPLSTIQIELADAQEVEPNTEINEKLFSFSPSIQGKASWLNSRTIEFIPDNGALKNGQTYEADFKLGKVIKVDRRYKTFHFRFKVEERNFDIREEPLNIGETTVAASGTIRSSDKIDMEVIKKAFTARTSDKQTLTPAVTATADPQIFRYSIGGIQRRETDIQLELQIDGKEAGISRTPYRAFVIPAINVFKVLSTELIAEPENGVLITFSSPISTTQDLTGLITLPELNSNSRRFTRQVQNNCVTLFFDRADLERITVNVDKGLKNSRNETLGEDYSISLSLEKPKPQIAFLRQGNIIPTSGSLTVPFRAVGLKAADLKIVKIYENNILMFLQGNAINGFNELRRAGRLVYKKTIQLDKPSSPKLLNWQNYSVDLSSLMRQEPGAIYRIELSFRKSCSLYSCDNSSASNSDDAPDESLTQLSDAGDLEENYWDQPTPYYNDDSYDWEYYDWSERDNPCHPSYYMPAERKALCNVMMSDIGVIAKSNSENNKWWITVSSLTDTKAIANADVTLYNYQLQPVGTAKTDVEGFALIESKGLPFVLVASANGQKTYLRLVNGENNSLSRFDTGGKIIEKGLKGFVYGERGVWRPGDTLHLTFILYDPEKRIPENHPVSLELYNARGQFAGKQILTRGVNGFYTYAVPTGEDAPTGQWNAYVKAGGATFHKPLRIETVKPNRLKINLSLPVERIDAAARNLSVALTSSWLTGAAARSLKAKVEMKLARTHTQFKGYEKYVFNDPASDFASNETSIFDGTLNEEGEARFSVDLPQAENAPGLLNANIVCRVFEQGGDASIYTQNLSYSPFSSYAGLNVNLKENSYSIETDDDHRFDVVTLNASGKPVDCKNLEYRIYKIGWGWWWENNSETSLASYVSNSSYAPVEEGQLETQNGKASFSFKLAYPEWGRYLIYVKNHDSGHATGDVVYFDWPEWRGRAGKANPDNVKMLTFTTDKTSYEAGEDITVVIPATGGGTALVALENGSSVVSRTRIALAAEGATKYTFKAAETLLPNFYIHISLLQPYSQTINELPIRMYGVMPVMITNKASVLTPQIVMPDVLRPETEFTVEVSEKSGKAMTYTLAVVDDGLLDLTNFKTPSPHSEFYAREALGIRTWDMYDFVMGAFGGQYASMFSTGGDEGLKPAGARANRFKPVVKHLGPFALNKGETMKHRIALPAYIGSVRTMVVAGQDGAFGKAEKTTPVRAPLMILPSLPRVVSVDEEISLPVNVFVMEDGVKDVAVEVKTSGLLQTVSKNTQSIRFAKPGERMLCFALKTGRQTGVEKVTVTATGGGQTSKETIEINVRNPNPAIIHTEQKTIGGGQTGEFRYRQSGTADSGDWARLEAVRFPAVNLTQRFDYLYDYEYYCSEQLTSRALPLLFISQFKDVDKQEASRIRKNIQEAIRNLYGRQLHNGGIVYWPGNASANDWITSYAGSFLVMAKEKGYDVNDGVLKRWKNCQIQTARNWTYREGDSDEQYRQAYRLYTLALAGAPEIGAMNRLKESRSLSVQARWCLAAAYALDSKTKAAEELVFNASTTVPAYYSRHTFGTSERDEAMILQTMTLMGRIDEALRQAQRMAKSLSQQSWFDTQTTAFALMAMGCLAEKMAGTEAIELDWQLNGQKQPDIRSAKAGCQLQLPRQTGESVVALVNKGKSLLHIGLISKYRPLRDTFPPASNNLRIAVSYVDLSGKAIDVSELQQGTDFAARIEVANTSAASNYTDIALTCIIPSGWEIYNERMTGGSNEAGDYRDVRDDRVLVSFDLPYGQSKTVAIRLQASYAGSFVLPAIQCEAMYEPSTRARTAAGRVKVVTP